MSSDPTGYDVVPLMQGFPGRSTHHGGLGWSSVTALRGEGRLVVVDTGGFGARPVLVRRLAEAGVDPDAVTDVLLTHAHYDHAGNYPLFTAAAVWVGADELDWAVEQPPGRTPVAELYAADLAGNPRTRRIDGADAAILPGIRAIAAPGHTPGSRVYVVRGREGPVVFTGDAAKNRAELLSGEVDMTLDADASRATVERIRGLWHEDRARCSCPATTCRCAGPSTHPRRSTSAYGRPGSRRGTPTTSPAPPTST